MAAVWAFCVGVQAEGVDCLPSPKKASNEDPTLSTTVSPTPYSWGRCSYGEDSFQRNSCSRGESFYYP